MSVLGGDGGGGSLSRTGGGGGLKAVGHAQMSWKAKAVFIARFSRKQRALLAVSSTVGPSGSTLLDARSRVDKSTAWEEVFEVSGWGGVRFECASLSPALCTALRQRAN